MRMRERAVLCLLLQILVSWTFWAIRSNRLQPELTAACAEAEYVFSVEIIPDTPAPSPAGTPEPAVTLTTIPSTLPPAEDTMLRLEVIRETAPPPTWAGKRVLIYHTHTWEAYEQAADAPYRETEKWRTKDNSCNVVAVGSALAASLQSLGLTVVHDTTAFEPPNLEDAYARSLLMLEERAAAGEEYDLYIDLHRDALSASSTIRRTVSIAGTDCARFMVLVGKGTTGGYTVKPDWEANLLIAQRITSSLNGQHDGLARDVKIKTGRFNQHVADRCILIECGVNTNTLQQVLSGIPYLAQAIADALAE